MDAGIMPGVIGGLLAIIVCFYFIDKAMGRQTAGKLAYGRFLFVVGFACAGIALLVQWLVFKGVAIEDSSDRWIAIALVVSFAVEIG